MMCIRRLLRFLLFTGWVFLPVTMVGAVERPPENAGSELLHSVQSLERELNARVGVAIIDSQTGQRWSYRGDERFPLTSTFKPLACAALLSEVDTGRTRLDRSVRIRAGDVVTYSPVTGDLVDQSITLSRACEAAITLSDNTAGNIVLEAIGGPEGLTGFFRELGDTHSRLDRTEPSLNEATPGDSRDSTTPKAVVETLQKLLIDGALSATSAKQLEDWMIADQVADSLFRARLPDGWIIADKSGAGGYGSRALIAMVRPPGREPVFAAVYLTETEASFPRRNSAIAAIGEALFARLIALH